MRAKFVGFVSVLQLSVCMCPVAILVPADLVLTNLRKLPHAVHSVTRVRLAHPIYTFLNGFV